MAYDINYIWCYGCLENRKDLSFSAPGFKLTQKVIFMPKIEKQKYENFPPCQNCDYPLKRHDFESNFRHASRGQNN